MRKYFLVSSQYPPSDTRLIIFRKQWKRSTEWTTLQCAFCTDIFERKTTRVKTAIKEGRTEFYCNASCASKGSKLRKNQGLVAKLVNAQD